MEAVGTVEPSVFSRFLVWLMNIHESLMPSHNIPRTVLGEILKLLAWIFILGPWEYIVERSVGYVLWLALMVNAVFVFAKVLVPLLAWRSWILVQLPQAPRLTSQNSRSRVAVALQPLILCLAMSDALSPVGTWVLSWAGQVVLFIVAAATGLFICLVLVASCGLDSRRNVGLNRVSGLEVTAQVAFAVSLHGLAHTMEGYRADRFL